jgi:hypothetical protein
MRNWTVGVLALLVAGCGQLGSAQGSAPAGRYTVIQAGNRTILLDTQEGRAWELMLDPQGVSRGWASINSLPGPVR